MGGLETVSSQGCGEFSKNGTSSDSTREVCRPEDTHNPSLARFYSFLTARTMDAGAKVPAIGAEVWAIERPARLTERLKISKLAEQLKSAYGFQQVVKQGKKKRFWREAIAEKRKDMALGEIDTKRIKVDFTVKKGEKDEDEEKIKTEFG